MVALVKQGQGMKWTARDIREHVGWSVRCVLVSDGLTQQDLATAVGCSRRGLHRKLWGQRDFTVHELVRVAKHLDRDLGSFIPQLEP